MTELKTLKDIGFDKDHFIVEQTKNTDYIGVEELLRNAISKLDLKQEGINWIKELRARPAITLLEMNIGASNYENPRLERELVKMMAHIAEQVFSYFFNIKESELK